MSSPPKGLPNPLTPMAFFPPDIARQMAVFHFVTVSSLVIMLWDMLNTVSVDIKLIRLGYNIPMVSYFLSRFSTLGFLLGLTILHTAPIGNCSRNAYILWMYPIQTGFTSLLFFVRVRAVYHDSKWVVLFFSFMWMGVFASSTTQAWGTNSVVNLGPTNYCVGTSLPEYTSAGIIVSFVNDTLIFAAITYKLADTSHLQKTARGLDWVKTVVLGHYLPAFSKAMLQDGQLYYLSTVITYLTVLILFYTKSLPMLYRYIFGIPGVALVNIMTCRVYRNARFGRYRERANSLYLPTVTTSRSSQLRPESVVQSHPVAFAKLSTGSSHSNDNQDGDKRLRGCHYPPDALQT